MPTVLRSGPYRFFYSGDRGEPPHIHIERDDGEAKFQIKENQHHLLDRWHEDFND